MTSIVTVNYQLESDVVFCAILSVLHTKFAQFSCGGLEGSLDICTHRIPWILNDGSWLGEFACVQPRISKSEARAVDPD